jgi:hypothetical protein
MSEAIVIQLGYMQGLLSNCCVYMQRAAYVYSHRHATGAAHAYNALAHVFSNMRIGKSGLTERAGMKYAGMHCLLSRTVLYCR